MGDKRLGTCKATQRPQRSNPIALAPPPPYPKPSPTRTPLSRTQTRATPALITCDGTRIIHLTFKCIQMKRRHGKRTRLTPTPTPTSTVFSTGCVNCTNIERTHTREPVRNTIHGGGHTQPDPTRPELPFVHAIKSAHKQQARRVHRLNILWGSFATVHAHTRASR